MRFVDEFKAFAMRGNVIDLAVGVVIGAAFGKIVSALVDAIVMPALGMVTSGQNFSELALTLGLDAKGAPVLLKYGVFLQSVVDFLLVALVIFLAVKAINRMVAPTAAPAVPAATPVPPAPSREEQLLTEIRDLLRQR
jgi:large conductance mechanosensitive channel